MAGFSFSELNFIEDLYGTPAGSDFMSFAQLGLPGALLRELEQAGLKTPTPVQLEAIPAVLSGKDLISSARTGSGKTLAFSLPLLARLAEKPGSTALILVPTREIAVQIEGVLRPFHRALRFDPPCLLIGGVSFGPQARTLRQQPRVIVATPGRLNDHLGNAKLRLDHVSLLVLDEADRMLDMGFLPQVKKILACLPRERQSLLFSATMPPELMKLASQLLRDPQRVAVDPPNEANHDVEQTMRELSTAGKQEALLDVLIENPTSVLVFTRTKRRTDRVAHFLEEHGLETERIHGDRSQAQRQTAIRRFREGKVRVLVATDIAARGLDIPLVELVVNYDLPEQKEDYVHRIGRTGRAGAKGTALSFVTPEDRGSWAMITGQRSEHPPAPARKPQGTARTRSRPPQRWGASQDRQPPRDFGRPYGQGRSHGQGKARDRRGGEERSGYSPRPEGRRQEPGSYRAAEQQRPTREARVKRWGAPPSGAREASGHQRPGPRSRSARFPRNGQRGGPHQARLGSSEQ